MKKMIDVLIIGAGPAGAACALQVDREGWSTTLVGDEPCGGLLRAARRLDNLPGFPGGIGGESLAERLSAQLEKKGIVPLADRVVFLEQQDSGRFNARTQKGNEIGCRVVVVASGSAPRRFFIDGWDEAEAAGRVHRDIRSLGYDLSEKIVAVIGGGEAALDSALSIRQRNGEDQLFVRGVALKTNKQLLREFLAKKSTIFYGRQLKAIAVTENGLRLRWNTKEGSDDTLADHLVVCIGREPRRQLLEGFHADVWRPDSVETSISGLYLAGDILHGDKRYAAMAMGDGQRAALAASIFLTSRDSRIRSNKRR